MRRIEVENGLSEGACDGEKLTPLVGFGVIGVDVCTLHSWEIRSAISHHCLEVNSSKTSGDALPYDVTR